MDLEFRAYAWAQRQLNSTDITKQTFAKEAVERGTARKGKGVMKECGIKKREKRRKIRSREKKRLV